MGSVIKAKYERMFWKTEDSLICLGISSVQPLLTYNTLIGLRKISYTVSNVQQWKELFSNVYLVFFSIPSVLSTYVQVAQNGI